MDIYLDDLPKICELLIQNIKEKGIDSIKLDADYYWNIPRDQLYNPYQRPVEFDLGQLSEDWNELSKILQSKNEPLAYHLV